MGFEMMEKIRNKLIKHSDTRIKDLINKSGTDVVTLSVLFAPHIDDGDFTIQYLTPGLSGAGIVSIISDNGLPFIIKYGRKGLIATEIENYQKIKDKIPHFILPSLREPRGNISDYGSLSYNWAGGWNDVSNLKEYLKEESDNNSICLMINSFMDNLFRWYSITKKPGKPFDQWIWDEGEIKNIKAKITR